MKQPKLPPGTRPLSSVIAVVLTDAGDKPAIAVRRDTLQAWLYMASQWEKLAAEYEAVVREAGLKLE